MLKKLLMLLALILLPLNLALAKEIKVNPKAPSYHNARFGFSLSWPSGEYKVFEAENGDGITLTDAQGLTFKAYGALDPRIEDNPLKAFFAKADKPAVYKKINRKQKWYVRSQLENGQIIYIKQFYHPDHWPTLYFSYPKALKAYYDPWVTAVVESFKPF